MMLLNYSSEIISFWEAKEILRGAKPLPAPALIFVPMLKQYFKLIPKNSNQQNQLTHSFTPDLKSTKSDPCPSLQHYTKKFS